jgi:hypothetical protein
VNAKDIASLGLSVAAIVISLVTAWATMWRRGRVRMTQPTLIHFGFDRSPLSESIGLKPKVYLRTLLFSSGKRGNIVENMYVRIRHGETVQTFNVWVLGERDLARGSGLYVGQDGITCNHHFLLPPDGTEFVFRDGEYAIEVFATLFRRRNPIKLHESKLMLRDADANSMSGGRGGCFFDWSPESERYHTHVESAPRLTQLGQRA